MSDSDAWVTEGRGGPQNEETMQLKSKRKEQTIATVSALGVVKCVTECRLVGAIIFYFVIKIYLR